MGLYMDLFFVNIFVKKTLLDEEYNEEFRSEIVKCFLFIKL